jgi:hypothetical protein
MSKTSEVKNMPYRTALNNVFNLLSLFSLIVAGICSADTCFAEEHTVSAITHYGVTWKFSQKVPYGRFVNGDYYVIGPVTVIDIQPRPENGRNGSELNPSPNPDRSGYDSREEEVRYDSGMCAKLPIQMKPGDSLVSAVSVKTIGKIRNWLRKRESSHSPINSYSVLTCLKKKVPADAFRSSYCDREQKIYLSRNLRRNLLPRLAYGKSTYMTDQGPIDLSEFEDHFNRTWLDVLFFEFDTPIEYMPQYPAELARSVGIASLILMTDLKPEEKEKLLLGIVQYGIDLWGVIRAGHPGWPAFGGHGSGRKWPIIFSGIMLGDEDMASPNIKYPMVKFGEDMQTMYDNCWTGAKVVYAGHLGKDGDKVKTGWGSYEHLRPKDWPDSQSDHTGRGKIEYIGETYRRCCTSHAWVGEALAARIMHAEKYWGHDAFFDYVDRWMTEDDTESIRIIKKETGKDFSAKFMRQKQAWDPFVMEMWSKYRNNLPSLK